MTSPPPLASDAPSPVDKSAPRVKRMFAEIAPRYDLMNHLLSLNVDRFWRWRTVVNVPPEGEGPILDVCTGTGDLAFAYDQAAEGRCPITATDFCREMLDIAEEKKRAAGIDERITFLEADTQHLPFPSDHFQIVSVAFGLRNISDTDAGLREMTRVCRPGGRVAILEFSLPEWQPFRAVYGWYFQNVLPRIGQLFASNDSGAYNYLPESVGQFPSGEALAERMRAAGLAPVEYHPLTLGIATIYIGHK